MANTDAAFGLRPYQGFAPSNAIPQARKYLINPSGYGTTIFQGDLVKFNGGYIEQAGVSDANIVGVFNGAFYQSADGPVYKNHYVASTTASSGDIEVYIYDDPNMLFLVQGDTATATTQAAVGRNADSVGTSGSTTTGLSSRELDVSTLATTQGLQLKVVGFADDDKNGLVAGTHANMVVMINEHAYRGPITGT
jgi:hypothetical protein